MTNPIYAVGDIHGDLVQLERIINWINADLARKQPDSHQVVFVGDLVDRREDSCGVIDYLIKGLADQEPWIILKGNHDRMFSLFLEENGAQDPILRKDLTWLHPRLGGNTTLASYGIRVDDTANPFDLQMEALKRVPAEHRKFLLSLPTHFETETLFFAHAGVNPKHPLDQQTEDDLIWIRAPFHEHAEPYEKLIIHGHTPIDLVTHYGNRINIDTGAAYGGDLSAIVLEGDQVWELGETKRTRLRPG